MLEKILNKALELAFNNYHGIKNISREDIIIEITKDNNINGKAYKKGEKFIIGISNSTYELLFTFYDILLQKENNEKKGGLYNIINNLETQEFNNISFNEEKSVKYRDFLIISSIYFLFYHELGHILKGHINYLVSSGDFNGFTEFVDFIDNNDLNLDLNFERKALEMDADAFAANLLPAFLFNTNDTYNITNEQALFISIYSVQTIFAFLGLGNDRKDFNLFKSKYLPARLRLDYIINIIFIFLERYNIEKGYLTRELVDDILPSLEKLYYTYMSNFECNFSGNENNNLFELSDDYKDYCNKLDSFIVLELEKKLSKFI